MEKAWQNGTDTKADLDILAVAKRYNGVEARYQIALRQLAGAGEAQRSAALADLRSAALAGHAGAAQTLAAMMVASGADGTIATQVSDTLRLAVNTGNPGAMLAFANQIYFADTAMPKLWLAAQYMRRAAEAGLPEAQHRLGLLLMDGLGVDRIAPLRSAGSRRRGMRAIPCRNRSSITSALPTAPDVRPPQRLHHADHPSDPVGRSRNAAVARIARRPSQAVPRPVRAAVHLPGDLEEGRDPALFERPIILTNRDHRFLVAEQTKEIGIAADIVLEPVRRDSGPAIAAGAHLAIQRAGPDAIVVVLAADHVIRDPAAFAAACANAAEAAARGLIVTFGMTPDRPETSYGYVKPGALLNGCALRALDAFVEKPDRSTAERYLADGYLWNSGNFLFGAATLLREYSDVDPQTVEAAGAAVANAVRDLDFIVLDEASFRRTTPQSIDYAVMERTKRAAVLPGDFGWSDVGSWDAVWALSPQDANGNVVAGPALMRDSKDSIVMSEKLTTAVIGVEGIAVIATEDAILVTRRTDAASLKALVGDLRKRLPNVTDCGAKVYRPWGMYQSLEAGDRHQVKRITVKPGGQLSLQKHHHRSEHWVVVRGTAKVVLGTSERVLYENESVYIPIGTVHRLTNPGKIDLELIEVQTGSYLGEDDIVRLEDVYNRSEEPESGPPASTRALATSRVT